MNTPRKSTRKIQRPPTGPQVRPSSAPRDGAPAGRPATARAVRSQPPSAPPDGSKTPMIIAGAVGGVAVLLLIVFMASGGNEAPQPVVAKRPAPSPVSPKTVDVSRLVQEGEKKCEEGYQIIRECQSMLERNRHSGGDSSELRAKLQRGMDLIKEGNGLLSEANDKSNGTQGFSDKKYIEALKLARGMIGELK